MTLLLACGSGGGGYSALPTPTVTPEPVEETEVFQASVVDIDEARKLKLKEKKAIDIQGIEDKIPEKPDERTTELPNNGNTPTTVPDDTNPPAPNHVSEPFSDDNTGNQPDTKVVELPDNDPIGSYEFESLGKWNMGIDGLFAWGFRINDDGRPNGSEMKGHVSSNNIIRDPDFAGAKYTGATFVERHNDKQIVTGKAEAVINSTSTALDFQFTELEGVPDIRFENVEIFNRLATCGIGCGRDKFGNKIGDWEIYNEVGDPASDFELYKGADGEVYFRGLTALFMGENDEFLGGAFYDWENNVKQGAFGTVKQP